MLKKMKYPLYIVLAVMLTMGCSADNKTEETESAENTEPKIDSAALKLAATFKTLSPGFFSVGLPDTLVTKKLETKPTECLYSISFKNGLEFLRIQCQPKPENQKLDPKTMLDEFSRAGYLQVTDSKVDIFGFELKGKSKENGHQVFLKRVIGVKYVSDLSADYPPEFAKIIEPLLPAIASTFLSL
jgi:hypothetical protein